VLVLVTMTVLALVALADPPAGKDPPTKQELAAITDRGRDLAGDQDKQQAAGIHTHVLSETPEGTYVFHVLTRKPTMPEFIRTEHFMFVVDVDGSIEFQRNAESPPTTGLPSARKNPR